MMLIYKVGTPVIMLAVPPCISDLMALKAAAASAEEGGNEGLFC